MSSVLVTQLQKIIQKRTDGLIVVEGCLAVEALIESDYFRTDTVFLESGRHRTLWKRACALELNVKTLSRDEIKEEAGFPFHRGVFATARKLDLAEPEGDQWRQFSKILAPVNLADGGNLGTLIRTAAAFGCDAVLMEAGKGADVYSRKCIRASATAIFRIPVFQVENLNNALAQWSASGAACYAAALHFEAIHPRNLEPAPRSLLLFGAEKDGLSDDVIAQCDQVLSFPMEQGMDSLNVAACGALMLYEVFGR